VPVPLQLIDAALEIRDQFVAAVNFADHLPNAGWGIGELPFQFKIGWHRSLPVG
jgi:hypothetical protein